MTRSEIFQLIERERNRQSELFGSEWDANNRPNDWIAKVVHYIGETIQKSSPMDRDEFEKSFIKAAAVIVAALEYSDHMVEKKYLSTNSDI
ncbi:MAG: hypothetical protein WC284_12745 [Candidimonas sp.]